MNKPHIPEPPPRLPDEVLSLQTTLPTKPVPVTLQGELVRLEPLDMERDSETLYSMSNGTPIELGERTVEAYDAERMVWRYMGVGPFDTLDAFRGYVQSQIDAPDTRAFCVFHIPSGQQVGVVTLMNNVPAHLKIELGGIWYSPVVQRTNANLESTYLLLQHVFALGYRRAEWKCHSYNERSRRAALRMGFQFEGIQEAHMIIKGRNRDTAWFRILAEEWPAVRQQLRAMLG